MTIVQKSPQIYNIFCSSTTFRPAIFFKSHTSILILHTSICILCFASDSVPFNPDSTALHYGLCRNIL